jgi:hypothetical protein
MAQLPSHLEDDPFAFYIMTVLSSSIALLVVWAGFRRCVTIFMGIFKCQLEKGLRKFVKSGSPAITAPIARSLIFLYRCESVISRVGRTSIVGLLWAAEMLICRDRGISTTAQRGDIGAMVSRQSAIFPLEARVIILIILM